MKKSEPTMVTVTMMLTFLRCLKSEDVVDLEENLLYAYSHKTGKCHSILDLSLPAKSIYFKGDINVDSVKEYCTVAKLVDFLEIYNPNFNCVGTNNALILLNSTYKYADTVYITKVE